MVALERCFGCLGVWFESSSIHLTYINYGYILTKQVVLICKSLVCSPSKTATTTTSSKITNQTRPRSYSKQNPHVFPTNISPICSWALWNYNNYSICCCCNLCQKPTTLVFASQFNFVFGNITCVHRKLKLSSYVAFVERLVPFAPYYTYNNHHVVS